MDKKSNNTIYHTSTSIAREQFLPPFDRVALRQRPDFLMSNIAITLYEADGTPCVWCDVPVGGEWYDATSNTIDLLWANDLCAKACVTYTFTYADEHSTVGTRKVSVQKYVKK